MESATSSPSEGARHCAPLWRAALPLSLAAALALVLVLGTFGYFAVGFGILTACTNDYGCTQVTCAPCRGAQGWLSAGTAGQGTVLLASVALLTIAARRGDTRRRLGVVGWALLTLAAAWFAATGAVSRGSS